MYQLSIFAFVSTTMTTTQKEKRGTQQTKKNIKGKIRNRLETRNVGTREHKIHVVRSQAQLFHFIVVDNQTIFCLCVCALCTAAA